MSDAPRFAVYFAPAPESALWRFGCQVIGYDAARHSVAIPSVAALEAARARGSFVEPARYGFHATLKAPFELRAGATEADLIARAGTFAGSTKGFSIGRLTVSCIDRFVALIAPLPSARLETLAARCVVEFDDLRAPLSPDDRARRLKARLTAAELAYLDRWGYPYVFEQFRFHMTLAGPLTPDRIEDLRCCLAGLYSPLDADVEVDAIAIFKQQSRSESFRLVRRFAFAD